MDMHANSSQNTPKKQSVLNCRVLEARTYWVCHLTSNGRRLSRTSLQIYDEIQSLAEGEVWEEAPAFYVFKSFVTIDHIAFVLRAVRRVKDTLVVGSFTHAECRIIGPYKDRRIFDLVPYAKGSGELSHAP